MSSRMSYALAVLILLIAAGLRLWDLATLPPGLNNEEITDIRITETIREGRISIFWDLEGEGREELYHVGLALNTSVVGNGLFGYRILSVWIGLLTLAVSYTLGTRLFGPLGGVATMALLAVSLWPVLLSRGIARDMLVPVLLLAVMLALARAFPVYYHRLRGETASTASFAVLGLLLGLGLYAHQSTLLSVLASMTFIVYMVASRRDMLRGRLGFIGFAILVMIIIATPYFIFSVNQPELAAASRLFSYSDGIYVSVVDGLAGIMFQGDSNPIYNMPGRPLIDLVSGFLTLLGGIMAVRYWRQPRFALPLIFAVMLAPSALLAPDSPNFLAFAAILPMIALFFGLGITTLYHSLPARTRWVALGGLTALLIFNIVWTSHDLFNRWPALDEVQTSYHHEQAQLAYHLDTTAGDIPSVICDPRWNERGALPEVTNTRLILQMMNYKTADLRHVDCNTGLLFANGGAEQQIILTEPGTLETIHPYISNWLLGGEILYDEEQVPANSVVVMDIVDELANSLGIFTTGAPVIFPPESTLADVEAFPPIRFGGNITFLGYELDTNLVYQPGDTVPVITYWRVEGVVPPDLIIFTHILADPATIATNRDMISVDPRHLKERDVFVQITLVELPETIFPGTYTISVGAYQETSNDRLSVLVDSEVVADRIFLYDVSVSDTTVDEEVGE